MMFFNNVYHYIDKYEMLAMLCLFCSNFVFLRIFNHYKYFQFLKRTKFSPLQHINKANAITPATQWLQQWKQMTNGNIFYGKWSLTPRQCGGIGDFWLKNY